MSEVNEFSTPMMQQYRALKAQYDDCLLFFRLGDFYEMFLDDAKVASEVLDITLTSRARGGDGRIPMAGVPFHAVDSYLTKLIQAGYKVAICEQLSTPNGRTLVEREVVRVVTPGTILQDQGLDRQQHAYLVALELRPAQLGLAAVDLTTGDFHTAEIPTPDQQTLSTTIQDIFTRLEPKECLLSPAITSDQGIAQQLSRSQTAVFHYAQWEHTANQAWQILSNHFGNHYLKGTELQTQPSAQVAAAVVLQYLLETQKTRPHHITKITPLVTAKTLQMDPSTITNLELIRTLRDGQTKGSLFHLLNHTKTAMGGRLLKKWLLAPLQDVQAIQLRQEAVQALTDNPHLTTQLRQQLNLIHDIERSLARLTLTTGNPRDLKAIEQSLATTQQLPTLLAPFPAILFKQLISQLLPQLESVTQAINTTIMEDPPVDPKQGNLIKTGVDPKLDELRSTLHTHRSWVAELEQTERQRTGITSLKVKYNKVFGFYIEVSKANLHLVPPDYQRKQTLVNAERFMTPGLKDKEELILQAEELSKQIEFELFTQTVKTVLLQVTALQQAAQVVATLDCLQALAEVARIHDWHCPEITSSGDLEITAGRHPVVEEIVGPHQYVPNSIRLSATDQQLLLLTGPNMAGKSVLMRQVALITLLAHSGSFVPAQAATIPLTDHIFVRSGASDAITAGMSTFMVEMVETSYIVRHATDKSLIIMDEIGRGTSTYDGISIAWAVAEFFVKNRPSGPKTLFATHYHELQTLADHWPNRIRNAHLAVEQHQGKPIFLYTLKMGGASHSFGVAVAKLAGLPHNIIEQAETMLAFLESQSPGSRPFNSPTHTKPISDPPTRPTTDPSLVATNKLISELQDLTIENMTPLQALTKLAELKHRYAND